MEDEKLLEYMKTIDHCLDNYKDIQENFKAMIFMTDGSFEYLREKKISPQETKQNHMTYSDVFELTKEIIKEIEPQYLEKFKSLIQNGTLDFNYDYANPEESHLCKHESSNFIYNPKDDSKTLNILRNFNYDDVTTLVHEFMHYANFEPIQSERRELFTEYFSIYFELYATKYLLEEKKIPKDEIDLIGRIRSTKDHLWHVYRFEFPYLLYLMFGNFDVEGFQRYYKKFTKEHYEYERNFCLKLFEKLQNDHEDLGRFLLNSYKYGLGGILAFWSLENLSKDQVLRFYKEIYREENKDLSLKELLDKYGINITKSFVEEVKKSIENYLDLTQEKAKHL